MFFVPTRLCTFPGGWEIFWCWHILFALVNVSKCVHSKIEFDVFTWSVWFFKMPSVICGVLLQ